VSPSSAHLADYIHLPIPESYRAVPDWSVCLQLTLILSSRRRLVPVDADHISHRRFYPVDADFTAD
ncbi:hypothetical protein KI387_004314, partial [Taxus chinensis]